MFARLKNDKDVFLFSTPRAWTEHFPQWQGSLSVVCRRFIYAQAQCFFVSCCLRGSANGMYVKTRLQKVGPQFIYAQAQCFFIPHLSSMACLRHVTRSGVFFSFSGDYCRAAPRYMYASNSNCIPRGGVGNFETQYELSQRPIQCLHVRFCALLRIIIFHV